ncbi:acyl-CoA N-acyltransferase [Flagelloscypha sp. PMI_526]|nr:acyl-CoA N-acyltransferase [Flagelloscypha sp. PMI_526]
MAYFKIPGRVDGEYKNTFIDRQAALPRNNMEPPPFSIRLYQESDHAAVVRLVTRANFTGRGSLYKNAFRYVCIRGLAPSGAIALVGWSLFPSIPGNVALLLACLGIFATTTLLITLTRAMLCYVRQAVETDLSNIFSLYKLRMTSDTRTVQADSPSAFWVAVFHNGPNAGKIVGCVGLDYDPKTSIGTVRRMMVDEDWRQQGIGRKLLDTLHVHATLRGVNALTLSLHQFQYAAIIFWPSCGFELERYGIQPLVPGLNFRIYYYRRILEQSFKA